MTDEIKGAVAAALKENDSGNNLTIGDFTNRRLKQLQPQPLDEVQNSPTSEEEEVTETEVEATEEPKEEAVEQTQEEQETKPTSNDDVLSQYDLDEMSEQDLRELAEKLGSRAVARFGELTAKRKAAEEQLAQLQQQLKQKQDDIIPQKPIEDNPYKDFASIDDIKNKAEELDGVIEWAEELIFESDGLSADDVVTEVEGKSLTKKEVRNALLNARKGRNKYLPAQLNIIKAKESSIQMEKAYAEKAKEELPWLSGEDNDVRVRYEAMINDNRFKTLKTSVDPDISSQLDYIIAHAANSIYGRKLVEPTKSKVKLDPPKTGTSSAPQTNRATKGAKALSDLSSRFKDSGTKDDFIKLRTLHYQNN
jgi:hypothetical protein